jgi:hypothetical protein
MISTLTALLVRIGKLTTMISSLKHLSSSKKSTVSCIQFIDKDENTYYKAWTLGNANMVQKLAELNASAAASAKK